MIEYIIYYKDIEIGLLQIDENEKYKYIVNLEGIEKVKNIAVLAYEMKNGTDWVSSIPFFKNRIYNAKRFGNEKEISSHTDNYKMIMKNFK